MSETQSVVASAEQNAVNTQVEARDEFGRLSSERVVELLPRDAELINLEVIAGEHDTYDDALHYVIERGIKEIKRVRDAQAATRQAKELKRETASFADMLKLKPSLVNDPEFTQMMIAKLTSLASK